MIYREAHTALAEGDEDKMHKFVTEKAFPEMMNMAKRKTIRWNFIKSLEPPRVVYARHMEILTKGNMFAQLTVRFHSQQTLAVYDRFGRLIHGSENVGKDVLEYCVFEKHMSNIYGVWRLHAKIIPEWMPKREENGRLTYLVTNEDNESQPKPSNVPIEVDHSKDDNEAKEDEMSSTLYDRFGRVLK